MSVMKRRLIIVGKHLKKIVEDGKRKEKMRCKTRCEIMLLCMDVLCARGTWERDLSTAARWSINKQENVEKVCSHTCRPLIFGPQALARAGPDSLDSPNALIL